MTGIRSLVVEVQTRACALPLVHVTEIMRPLPVEPISGVPPFVRGVSIVRGVPTPVINLAVLLGASDGVTTRFVTLRIGDRQVALGVSGVLGIHEFEASTIQALPPLLQRASNDAIEAISTLDSRVLVVLRAAWELPEEVWSVLSASGSPSTRSGEMVSGDAAKELP